MTRIAAAVARFGDDPRIEQVVICCVDKDLASASRASASCCATGCARSPTTRPASSRSSASDPTSIPDYLALVGDSSDGYPGPAGLGREERGGGAGEVPAPRGHPRIAARLGA